MLTILGSFVMICVATEVVSQSQEFLLVLGVSCQTANGAVEVIDSFCVGQQHVIKAPREASEIEYVHKPHSRALVYDNGVSLVSTVSICIIMFF